ncbi:hypothetical protein BF93_16405 [Brachybacterium phenoliresistens]|uniref:Uncharacterized protein n=1 Tax=Brachybacterium phenoliresistens TaxID=396014 RepID=Z9JUP1_9MICO|nr:hypothetical protein BF93_16405 [Brachybacterium phenoliresistens]
MRRAGTNGWLRSSSQAIAWLEDLGQPSVSADLRDRSGAEQDQRPGNGKAEPGQAGLGWVGA